MDTELDWVVIGCFGRAHGIRGQITVHSFTEPRDNMLHYTHWHVWLNKQWQALNIVQIDSREKNILARVEGYADREQVARLTNAKIAIKREQLPVLPKGSYYWHELIGMEVVSLHGFAFGKVIEIIATGANDVLVVEGEKHYLIPYLPGLYVCEVDADKRIITVDWDADF